MKKKKVIVSVIILIVTVLIFYLIANSITKHTGYSVLNNKIENCLEEKDITIYINSYNSLKTLNNLETKDYLSNVEIVNCLLNKLTCMSNDVSNFPSWDINDKRIEGDISVDELVEFSGC